jgi:hypothetical protein
MITSLKIDFSDLAAEVDELGRGSAPTFTRPRGERHAQPRASITSGYGQGDV